MNHQRMSEYSTHYANLSDPRREIADSISSLRKRVANIEAVSGQSQRTIQLRDEIKRLESLSVYDNVRTDPTYRDYFGHDCYQ